MTWIPVVYQYKLLVLVAVPPLIGILHVQIFLAHLFPDPSCLPAAGFTVNPEVFKLSLYDLRSVFNVVDHVAESWEPCDHFAVS